VKTVVTLAHARFTLKSGESQGSDSKDRGWREEESSAKVQEQAQLREENDAPEKIWTKLGLNKKLLSFQHSD
jgi:hypothetical protein